MKIDRLALAAVLLCSGPAWAAVNLAQNGYGQGLLFPYATVKAGQSTLISLENASSRAKAVKLNLRGGDEGFQGLHFNVYVPAHGKWSASMADLHQRGMADISLGRTGCISIDPEAAGYPQADGPFTVPGREVAVGTYEFDRTFIVEAVELGELSPELTAQMDDCNAIHRRWRNGGAWRSDTNADVTAPTGGLKGNALVLDLEEGTSFGYQALAFNGLAKNARQPSSHFRTPFLHHIEPDADGKIRVELTDSTGQARTLVYGADQGMEALSALLAASRASVMVEADGSLGSRTDIVVSFPTRHGFVGDVPQGNDWDHQPGSPILVAPFTGAACESVHMTLRDADGSEMASRPLDLCGGISVIQVRDPLIHDQLLGDEDDSEAIQKMSGSVTLDFASGAANVRESRPDEDNLCYQGLPVWVMAVTAYEVAGREKLTTFPIEAKAGTETTFVDCAR